MIGIVDVVVLVVVLALAILGWYTGLIRRVIGFAAMYGSFFVATHLDATAAAVWQQSFVGWSTPDALTVCFVGIVVILFVVIEILVSFVHRQLQLAPVALDRATGVLIGAVTGFTGAAVMLWLLWASVQASSFVSPDARQIQVRDAIKNSASGVALAESVGHPLAQSVFVPVVPNEPAQFLNNAHTSS